MDKSGSCISLDLGAPALRAGEGPANWVQNLVGNARLVSLPVSLSGLSAKVSSGSAFNLISVHVNDAASLAPHAFQQAVAEAYKLINNQLSSLEAQFPVRFWNQIPGIHDRMDANRDRYMVFNAARFAAFCDWYGGPDAFPQNLPTASAVGHRGQDLFVHCLASISPGTAVENPRQIPPYRYSSRFGPQPPCFSRATVLDQPRLILIGGTASIRGEESLHLGDPSAQTSETLKNLASLICTASGLDWKLFQNRIHLCLNQFRELRIYYLNDDCLEVLRPLLARAFPGRENIELLQAELCRRELLVEIEGVAEPMSA
jgi:hypothetical protein